MRRDIFADSGNFCLSANNQKNHFPRELASAAVEKEYILRSLCYRTGVTYPHIEGDAPYCRFSDGYQTLLGALAGDPDKLLGQKEVADAQIHQFAHPQSAGVKYLDDGFIALSFAFRKVKRIKDALHLIDGEYLRKISARLWSINSVARILLSRPSPSKKR